MAEIKIQELKKFIGRFEDQKNELFKDGKNLDALIIEKRSSINKMLISGMGACTMILRMGAVYLLGKKLQYGEDNQDALFLKRVLVNLSETLPSDTNWFNIWHASLDKNDEVWAAMASTKKGQNQSILEQFITFRNKYVHQSIVLEKEDVAKIGKGIEVLAQICEKATELFAKLEISFDEEGVYFCDTVRNSESGGKIKVNPFMQIGKEDAPYLFQGLIKNDEIALLIGTKYGDLERRPEQETMRPVFDPMKDKLRAGIGQYFDHSNRIDYYADCFVGREDEIKALINFSLANNEQNIVRVFSQAGMGKGALLANVIRELKVAGIPVLYHFCGSGVHNNLQAVLYHFMLQGNKRLQIWNTSDKEVSQKLERMPLKYHDAIHFFQDLLDKCIKVSRNNTSKNLIIVIDGLDEAAVAYSTLHISDWFYKYGDKGEIKEDWSSKKTIRWIFSHREGFYRFPNLKGMMTIPTLQPLIGLSENSVRKALGKFEPSEEFFQGVFEKGRVIFPKNT